MDLKIGSDEWFERLNRIVTFPERIIFYYDKEEHLITTRIVESKAKIGNIRYQDIAPSGLAFQIERNLAIVTVKEIKDDEEFHDVLIDLRKEWGIVDEVITS